MQPAAVSLAKVTFQKAARNFGWLVAERGMRFVLGTAMGFLIARHLGPGPLGALSYCLAVVTLLQCVAGFGVDAIVRRDLLQNPEHADRLLAGSLQLRLLAGSITAAGLLAFVWFSPWATKEESQLFLILGMLLWQPAWTVPELWLHAHLRARYAVVAQTAALAMASAARGWMIFHDAPLAAFAAANVLEAVLAGIALHFGARRAGLRVAWLAPAAQTVRRLAAESAPLLLSSLAIVVYMRIDEIMLRQLAGPGAVGIYAAATRLSEIWYFLPVALASSLLPALMQARADGPEVYAAHLQRYFDISAAAALLLAAPVALLAPWIISLAYGAPYAESAPVLGVHIWTSIFVFSGVARGQWLVNEEYTRFYLYATLAGALTNVALNFLFVPRWGPVGAAWATLIAYALAAWLSSFMSGKTRTVGWMQTRALLLPIFGWRYLRR